MGRNPTVGVFDSGLGGLTVAREIRTHIPSCDIIYCSDNKNFPYGSKSDSEVIRCATATIRDFTAAHAIDCLVIACNTASTVALPALREAFPMPIVGVVPAVKPAAELSKTKKIALIATPGTISREYTEKLIREFASDCDVRKVGSVRLVEYAEAKLRGKSVDRQALKNELGPLTNEHDVDIVVLGCTHFPLLREELASLLPGDVTFIDSGEAIAKRVATLLPHSLDGQKGGVEIYLSQETDDRQLAMRYLNGELESDS